MPKGHEMEPGKKTVAIIGAGIVGVSAAIWLQREGHKVLILDKKGPAEGASYGNGGVLASCSVVPVTVPGLIRKIPKMLLSPRQPLFLKWAYAPRLVPFMAKYLSHATLQGARETAAALAPIVSDSLEDHKALARGTPAEKWIKPCDYLYVYNSRKHYEADWIGWSIRRENGFKWEELEGEAFREYDPCFSESLGFAVRLANHGRISDPGKYVKDLAAHAVACGAKLIKAEATGFETADGKITGVRTQAELVECDAAVVATGAWSKPLAKAMGVSVDLESERGYHVELESPSLMPKSPVMIASGKFVATPMEGRLRLAGIVEFGGLKAAPSKAPIKLLLESAKAAMPGLKWTGTREWMGHRPATASSVPVIGESPAVKGGWLGFGHQHVGMTGGPKTGWILANMISGRKLNLDLSPYLPK